MNKIATEALLLKYKIDIEALSLWLKAKLALGADQGVVIQSAKIPKTGYSALTVLMDVLIKTGDQSETRKLALRLEKTGQDIFLDTDIARQGEMMMALSQAGIAVPNVIGTESDPSVLGGKFLVMDYLDAHSLPQSPNYHLAGLLPTLSPDVRNDLWSDAVTTIAKINKLEWQTGFEFLNKNHFGPPGLQQYLNWLQAWRDEATGHQANPIIDQAIAQLIREQPNNPHVDVLWGDSNPGNYLFNDSGAVAAVLDFEAAALGPAEIDLAWWFFMDEMLTFGVECLEGIPDREQQISLYEQALGRSVDNLPYYELLAAVRIALVIARTALLLIESGLLPKDNKTALHNPAIQLLASRLEISGGDTGEDYAEFARVLNERD